MRTSPKGIAFLERHEGVVLRAYRDPVGVLTIGAGLTKASGVVVPEAGMEISKEKATRLLNEALKRNYEPAVLKSMQGADQHEFDGGVSFHWNTGAIGRASWVKAWRSRTWAEVAKGLRAWRKGGGRVLPGLVRRREEELRLIQFGDYGVKVSASLSGMARVVVPMSKAELAEAHKAFEKLGYNPGNSLRGIEVQAVRDFQHDHDLTEDGIIGRATLSTLQRRLDAVGKSATAVTGTTIGGAGSAVLSDGPIALLPGADWMVWAALGFGAVWMAKTAWDYRDVVAVKSQNQLPSMARFLRSF